MKPYSNVRFRHGNLQTGFTLLEVLIAIAIFSVISLTSFTIFDTVLRGDETSKARTQRLNELQRGFLMLERDITQVIRRSVRVNGESPQQYYLYADNLDSDDIVLAFVRAGWTNPGLLLPRSDLQGVAYRLDNKILMRYHSTFVDPIVGEEPKSRELITGVNEFTLEFYQNGQWRTELDNTSLPLAVAVELDTEDLGLIRRQFLVAGDLPKAQQGSGS